MVPYIGPGATLGQRVTVAWNAAREAARAVNDALPMLERAQAVDVVTVNPSEAPFGHGEEPGADIGLHLARHGVKVEVATHRDARPRRRQRDPVAPRGPRQPIFW